MTKIEEGGIIEVNYVAIITEGTIKYNEIDVGVIHKLIRAYLDGVADRTGATLEWQPEYGNKRYGDEGE